MSAHLPECPAKPCECRPRSVMCRCADCICPALRACEQRMTRTLNDHYWTLGVQAARDAIARAPGAYSGYPLIERIKALAAIDALRGYK